MDLTALFLFGAGASYGSVDVDPDPPPLGTQLFNVLKNFPNSIFETISDEVAQKFEQNFEVGMAEFAAVRETDLSWFQRELGLFFCKYNAGINNLYAQLSRLLRDKATKPIFATTNYDLLIEQSLLGTGYRGISYAVDGAPDTAAELLKIHGSCNFWPAVSWAQMRSVRNIYVKDIKYAHVDAPVEVVASISRIIRNCTEQEFFAPAMAIYTEGKRVFQAPKFIKFQQSQFANAVNSAERIYVIGLQVNPSDKHIWDSLAGANAPLAWAGQERDKFEAWAEAAGRKKARWICNTFAEALPIIDQDLA